MVTYTAWSIESSVARDLPNITAWTTARLMPLTGMITRCSRWGRSNTRSSRTASSFDCESYWRRMKSMMPTRVGIMITTRKAPSTNFTDVTTTAITPVSTAPTALIASRYRQPGSRVRSQWRTMPVCEIVKSMNTPTAYSGISAWVEPPPAITTRAAIPPSSMIPVE